MQVSIDRIEEGVAVLIGREDERIRLTVPASVLPPGSREGDVLTLTLGRDPAATTAARERVTRLIASLEKDP